MTTYETCSGCSNTFIVPSSAWNPGEGWRHDYCSKKCHDARKPKAGATRKPNEATYLTVEEAFDKFGRLTTNWEGTLAYIAFKREGGVWEPMFNGMDVLVGYRWKNDA